MFPKLLVFVNRYTTTGRIHETRIKHMSTQLLQDLFTHTVLLRLGMELPCWKATSLTDLSIR